MDNIMNDNPTTVCPIHDREVIGSLGALCASRVREVGVFVLPKDKIGQETTGQHLHYKSNQPNFKESNVWLLVHKQMVFLHHLWCVIGRVHVCSILDQELNHVQVTVP